MKFLANIYNPTMPEAKEHIMCLAGETQQEAWEHRERWLSDKVLGVPQETDIRTVLDLVRMGMVGVYLPDETGV